jgi:hypothetical protein
MQKKAGASPGFLLTSLARRLVNGPVNSDEEERSTRAGRESVLRDERLFVCQVLDTTIDHQLIAYEVACTEVMLPERFLEYGATVKRLSRFNFDATKQHFVQEL